MSLKKPKQIEVDDIEVEALPNLIDTLGEEIVAPLAFLIRKINKVNQVNGWNEENPNKGEMIALMHSELSECLEWLRKGHDIPSNHLEGFTGEEEELADILIRVFHYAARFELKLPQAIIEKVKFNLTRGFKHGGKNF